MEPHYLSGLSSGAQHFFNRFIDTFGQQITRHADAGESLKDARQGGSNKYQPYLHQAREHMQACGIDPGVLARL